MIPALLLLSLLVLVARILVATHLDLFGDEAFYWMCAQRLDVAYVDHPFMTALLVRGGAELVGPSPLGVRALFLVLGALLPGVIYLLARPLVGRRDACLAAAASLVIPVLAHGGVVAIPDVPLLFWSALALVGFERATRTGSTGAWLLAGAAAGLGLATHYRAILVPVSFFLYLILTPGGRRQWTQKGVWIALLALLPGLLPILLFNLRLGFAPLEYQAIGRHAGGFSVAAFAEHLPLQAALVTPLLYVALLGVLARMLRRASSGDDRAGLLAVFSLTHLGIFLLASPVADTQHAAAHWPAPGYLPLVVFLPALLREFVARRPTRSRRAVIALVPALGLLGLTFVLVESRTNLFGFEPLRRSFSGWSTAAAASRDAIATLQETQAGPTLLVADSYPLGGNLEMRLGGQVTVYVLDHPKHQALGRAGQFALWGRDEAGLRARGGETAIVVFDRDQSKRQGWDAWLARAHELFEPLVPLSALEAPGKHPGVARFYLFRGVVRSDPRRVLSR